MDFFDILLAKKLEDDRDPTIEGLSVTENGTYSEEGKAYNPVIVNVPEPTLITKTITANGTYTASDDNADGYSRVTVAVEGFKKKSIANTPTDIASFADGTANPMTSLKISIEPVQSGSGDPSPSNIRPISGWTGANIGVNGKNFCDIGSASFTKYGRYPLLLPSGTYTLSSTVTSTDTDGNDCYFGIYDNSDNLLIGARLTRNDRTSYTFTLSSYGSYITLYAGHNSSQSVGDDATWANIQIELGSLATDYEAYVGSVVPVSWQTEAGEVYDGYIDYEQHKVVVNRIDYTITSTRDFLQNGEDVISMSIPSEYRADVIPKCEAFEGITKGSSSGLEANQCRFNNGLTNINFKFSAPKTVDEWKAELAINPIKLLLGLITHIEYDLDAVPMITTLLGENNIFADCGQILEGEYFVTL